MKTLARKTWQKIVALFLVVVSLFGLLNLPPIKRAFAADEYTGTGTFTQCTGALSSGYYVFGGGSATDVSAINNTVGTSWIKYTATPATNGTIANPDTSIVWYYDAEAGTFKNGDNYIYWPSEGNSGGVGTKNTPVTVTETATAGVYNITVTATPARVLRLNTTNSGYRFYTSSTGKAEFYFFKLQESAGGETTDPEQPSCEHANKVAIGEAKAPTCTEDGITAGEKCADCDEVITKQETIDATGHTYVDGVCSVCSEKQPLTLTITKANFTGNAYDWNPWTATTSTDNNISGFGFTYGAKIQVNGKQTGDYIYNTDPLPGKITSITLVKESSASDREFDILTADTPFDHETTASLKDQATDKKQTVSEAGATWTFDTNHKYFAIVIVESGSSTLSSIEITYEICKHVNTTAIGEAKDATCTEDGITAGEKCVDCGEVITEQATIDATGHTDVNPIDSKCDTCGANLCTEHVWIEGEIIKAPTCTETGLQAQICENCGQPNTTDIVLDKIAHTSETDEAVAPTCTATGLTEGSHCSVCEEVLVEQTVVDMVAHNYVDGKCSVCSDIFVDGDLLADFQFGENGDASHKDGSAIDTGKAYTNGNYTLKLTNAVNVYDSAYDAKGNSALKLGTSKAAASFAFTVNDSVNTVVLYVAGYKTNTAKINVNDTEYAITSKSDEGDYTKIVVDTKTTKTITFETLSGGYRAMLASIQFWGEETEDVENGDKFSGCTAILGDVIGLNFYMELTDETLADETAYVQFTLPNGSTSQVFVKDVKGDESQAHYKFSCGIAVKEIADEITAQLITANGATIEYAYSVKAYAEYIISKPEDYTNEEIALAKALLNYGAYAQVMFDYKTDSLANSALDEADKSLEGVSIDGKYAKSVSPTAINGVAYLGTTTVWESNTVIRHYFAITGENITFKLCTADGTFIKDLEAVDGAYGKCVEIDGIVAKDMSTKYNLVISNGTETQTIEYSVYSYFYDILNSTGTQFNEGEKNAIKAAYLYAEAASEYLASK